MSRKFFYVVTSQFTLATNGTGTIASTPSLLGNPTNGAILEVGRPYQLLAAPGPNNVFSNWTGVPSINPKLTFIMQHEAAGLYDGLFSEIGGVSHHSSGFMHVKLKQISPSARRSFCFRAESICAFFRAQRGSVREVFQRAAGGLPIFPRVDVEKLSGVFFRNSQEPGLAFLGK
jgi:hypothetical protein